MSKGNRIALAWRAAALGVVLAGLQAASVYGVMRATPALQPWAVGALAYLTLFIPPLIAVGAGVLRPATLALWTVAAAAIVAGLGAWATVRSDPRLPSPAMGLDHVLTTVLLLVVLQVSVEAADKERRPLAAYPTYFAAFGRLAGQLGLALVFLGTAYLALLFFRMGLSGLAEDWAVEQALVFTAPLMLAMANEALAGRPGLAPQFVSAVLVFARRLLPIAVLAAAAGFVGLAIRGGHIGFSYPSPTVAALMAGTALILLVNAAYGDGTPDWAPGVVVRWSTRAAAVCLAVFVVVAGIDLWTSLADSGFTPERVGGLAWLGVLSVFAIGYILAAVRPGPWMRATPAANVAGTVAMVAAIAALQTPLADSGRIAAEDQYARLASGQPPPNPLPMLHLSPPMNYEQLLSPDYGRFGREAIVRLAGLKTGPYAADVARTARLTLAARGEGPIRPDDLAARIRVRPAGAALPKGFLETDWDDAQASDTVTSCGEFGCDAYLIDVDHDGEAEVLLTGAAGNLVFKRGSNGAWTSIGQFDLASCDDEQDALKAGRIKAVDSPLSDLEIAGRRYRIHATVSCGQGAERWSESVREIFVARARLRR